MKRRLLNLLALLSLFLLAATLALWARSYWVGDEVHRLGDRRGQYLGLCRGRLTYFAGDTVVSRQSPEWEYIRYPRPLLLYQATDSIEANVHGRPGSRGFRAWDLAYRRHRGSGRSIIVLMLPLWLPTVSFAIAPVLWIRRRRRRARPGLCPHCNYDLRATPDRCPECGRAPTTTTTTTTTA